MVLEVLKDHGAFIFLVQSVQAFCLHCLTVENEGSMIFQKTSETTHQTQCNTPEDQNAQQHCCENLKSLMVVVIFIMCLIYFFLVLF